MNTFTETVEIVVFWQSIDELNELVLVDKVSALGGEDDIAS